MKLVLHLSHEISHVGSTDLLAEHMLANWFILGEVLLNHVKYFIEELKELLCALGLPVLGWDLVEVQCVLEELSQFLPFFLDFLYLLERALEELSHHLWEAISGVLDFINEAHCLFLVAIEPIHKYLHHVVLLFQIHLNVRRFMLFTEVIHFRPELVLH